MWPSLSPMLSSWLAWTALAAVPPAIVLLYFLKLKRQPVEVPSTYLWLKSIEDLHVNSIWQKMRQSLLLFLQLLLILLAIFALLRPTWNSQRLVGDRFIFLIDTSASMAASDVKPTRLEEAKRRVKEAIEKMEPDAVGMVISFSDTAKVEQQFTGSKRHLLNAVDKIRQTNHLTNIKEALQAAAGLANPGRSGETGTSDIQVAEAKSAVLKIYSDGGMDKVEGFSLGNLHTKEGQEDSDSIEEEFIQIGEAVYEKPDAVDLNARGKMISWAKNVGIVAFSARRKEGRPNQLEAFARLENFGPGDASAEIELLLNGQLVDARKLEFPQGEGAGVPFDLGEVQSGVLEIRARTGDVLEIDDRAWTTVNPPSKAKVLLLTVGNESLEFALSIDDLKAEVVVKTPDFLTTPEYKTLTSTGSFGLVIYDRCAPKEMPLANTLFIGALPPGDAWAADAKANVPQILDSDRSHPLMQLIDMANVIIVEGTPLKPPRGSKVLMDSHVGPLFAIASRSGYEDAVLGFELAGQGQQTIGTNWPVRLSFPVFVRNVLDYLGGVRDPLALSTLRPGNSIALQSDAPTDLLTVRAPNGALFDVRRGNLNAFHFANTEQTGVYEVLDKSQLLQRFAVNLFHGPESDIKPKSILIGHRELKGNTAVEPARRELWKVLLLVGLAVLLFEWYIYNRRVYL